MKRPGFVQDLCKSCGICVKYCPKKIIKIGEVRNSQGFYFPVIDLANCIGCGTCALVCPEMAIELTEGGEEA